MITHYLKPKIVLISCWTVTIEANNMKVVSTELFVIIGLIFTTYIGIISIAEGRVIRLGRCSQRNCESSRNGWKKNMFRRAKQNG
ncbi:hypothetical protein EB796_006570 [Bugula neritina]|uniref:Uncharacterized protein n=1 Tax=Bugula neritina TaxID=10212 RepID=A0A7J7KB00_BUGNE|nr:hypothetical protein EB796_006570 [Bugula neritina]